VRLHGRADLRLEVRADGEALVFGQILAPSGLCEAGKRERCHEASLLLAERVGTADDRQVAIAGWAIDGPSTLRLPRRPCERLPIAQCEGTFSERDTDALPLPADGIQVVALHVERANVPERVCPGGIRKPSKSSSRTRARIARSPRPRRHGPA